MRNAFRLHLRKASLARACAVEMSSEHPWIRLEFTLMILRALVRERVARIAH